MTGALAAKTLISLVLVALCGAAPAAGPSQDELSKAYLSRFFSNVGVSAPNSVWRSSLDSFDDTLRKMQEFFGLAVTGTLDSNTLEVMDQPRCGFTDVARFAHFDGRPRWDKTLITYRITEYTPDLSRSEVDATIAQAFKLYSDVTPLNFKQINTGTADIMIFFKEKDHGDFSPFDGPGKVLAHAFSPGEGRGGDTHFDEDEQWSLNARVNLLLVAAHELGHALGLAHSKDRTALMFPNYQYVNTQGYKLPEDDKQGVQAIYGENLTPELESTPEPLPDRCYRHLRFDAATSIEDNLFILYQTKLKLCFLIFTFGHFWAITTIEIMICIAYVCHLTGDHYWGVRGNTVLPGYPKPLSDLGFPPSVTKVDAAVYVTFTGRTLLFERHRYWSFNNRRGRMDAGYPKLIYRDFRGIGYKVDSAFENNGYLYFSAGYRQTEYHYPRRRVLRTLLNYSWLDCN
uniref:Matrix metallopeptidase 30 n=1 Tax=Myripristis murdjan TaxID=586833 RepID=A0A667XMB7_9TELE